jgi:hypothetical protein
MGVPPGALVATSVSGAIKKMLSDAYERIKETPWRPTPKSWVLKTSGQPFSCALNATEVTMNFRMLRKGRGLWNG